MGNINAPNLRYLHIPESIILACFTTPLLPLRFLDVWENVFAMPASFFVDFLQKCPQLAHIHFALGRQFYIDGPSWPESRITIPLLRSLNFESFAGQNPMLLLRSLHLPALELLDFGEFLDHEGAVSNDPTFKRQLIWYFLPETSATLKTLILHGGCIPTGNNIVEPLLAIMRNVETLSFLNTEVKPSFLELLIPSDDDPHEAWVMPRLTSLTLFETDIEGDAIFRVIRSRALSDEEIRIIQADSKDGLIALSKNDPLHRKTLRHVQIRRCAVLEDAIFSELMAIRKTHSRVVRC
ncbi:hypothetical protein BU17DRAFT_79563 [Hysterangium stoloniferum]|nr:hypothetical protein BU17DRAFT_79563 [Hysterangium stoloniferum]